MLASNITSKGQVTLPAAIRKQLNLKAGDRIVFTLEGNKIIAEPVTDDVSSLFGTINTNKTVSLEQMDEVIAKAASST
jgi:AbrB family looped-hinge helix DNA binding protein